VRPANSDSQCPVFLWTCNSRGGLTGREKFEQEMRLADCYNDPFLGFCLPAAIRSRNHPVIFLSTVIFLSVPYGSLAWPKCAGALQGGTERSGGAGKVKNPVCRSPTALDRGRYQGRLSAGTEAPPFLSQLRASPRRRQLKGRGDLL